MTTNYLHHLTAVADQLTSVLFYMRNSIQVQQGGLLFHKQPDFDRFRSASSDEEYWHDLVQVRLRYIQWYSTQPLPELFYTGIQNALALYERKRSEYLYHFPERQEKLVTQPLPKLSTPPSYPTHDDYPVGEYDAFYRACYLETVQQVDAYRWMCDIDMCLEKHRGMDLMVPPRDTDLPYEAGWQSIEEIGHSLMGTLLNNYSERRGVRSVLAEYGTDTTLKGLAVLNENLGQWIRRSMEERREKQQ